MDVCCDQLIRMSWRLSYPCVVSRRNYLCWCVVFKIRTLWTWFPHTTFQNKNRPSFRVGLFHDVLPCLSSSYFCLIHVCCDICIYIYIFLFFFFLGGGCAWQVYEQYPSLLAEQTAYATAAASLNLRHYRINNYAIESEKVGGSIIIPWSLRISTCTHETVHPDVC